MSSSLSELKRKVKLAADEIQYEFGDAGFRNQAYKELKSVSGMTSANAVIEAVERARDEIQYEFGHNNAVYEMLSNI
jgi:hypothetical protein